MRITSKTAQGKALLVVALSGALISSTGFLGQSALAATPTQSPMPTNMVMPKAAPTTAPKAVLPPKSQVPAPKSSTPATTKAAPKVSYTLAAGKALAGAKGTLAFSLKSGPKASKTNIGAFTADKLGTIAFTYKSTIPKTATIYVSVKGKATIAISASKLKLAKVPTIARPFVPPTPITPLVPVPVPVPTPTTTPTPTPTTPAEDLSDLTPVFGTATPTKDGYIIQLANYDSNFTWSAVDAAGGVAFISSTGQITVTKLAASTKTSVTVTTDRTGHPRGTATSASITVLAADAAFTPPPFSGGGGSGGGGVITVTLKAPAITLSVSTITVNQLDPLPTYKITNTGDPATSYALSPAAPAGTTFNTTSGILSGAPTDPLANTAFTITATNASGTSRASFSLTVLAGVNQQISFNNPVAMRVGAADQALQAASSSSLAVTYSVAAASSAICSLVPGTPFVLVHALAAGTCTLNADQAGVAPYFAAPRVTVAFSIIATNSTSIIVVIDPNGGVTLAGSADITSQVLAPSTPVTLPSLTNAGYTLAGWATGTVNGAPVTSPLNPIADITVVAKWA